METHLSTTKALNCWLILDWQMRGFGWSKLKIFFKSIKFSFNFRASLFCVWATHHTRCYSHVCFRSFGYFNTSFRGLYVLCWRNVAWVYSIRTYIVGIWYFCIDGSPSKSFLYTINSIESKIIFSRFADTFLVVILIRLLQPQQYF